MNSGWCKRSQVKRAAAKAAGLTGLEATLTSAACNSLFAVSLDLLLEFTEAFSILLISLLGEGLDPLDKVGGVDVVGRHGSKINKNTHNKS